MDDQHHGAAPGRQFAHGGQYQLLVRQVQGSGGFVQQQQAARTGIPDLAEDPRQLHPLFLAAGQVGVEALAQAGDIGDSHHLRQDRRGQSHACVVGHPAQGDHFLDGVGKIEQGQLWQVGQAPGQLPPWPVARGS